MSLQSVFHANLCMFLTCTGKFVQLFMFSGSYTVELILLEWLFVEIRRYSNQFLSPNYFQLKETEILECSSFNITHSSKQFLCTENWFSMANNGITSNLPTTLFILTSQKT